jgi:dienelactone hydrolase
VTSLGHVIAVGALLLSATVAGAADVVDVDVTAPPRPATLRATVQRPKGEGVWPALIFLHGCGGLGRRQTAWADELSQQGYLVLVLDSFGARTIRRVCGDRTLFPPPDRAEDVFAAVRALQRRPDVDRARIGVIGWSHGGSTALAALAAQSEHPAQRLRAAIAFYPGCLDAHTWKGAPPLLMLLGASDDWTPAERCTRLAHTVRGFGERVETVVYPGTYHAFDDAGLRQPVRVRDALGGRGATVAYNPTAHADAREQVRAFLARELKGP